MSDGPHKSLNMKPGWKKVAERADLAAFEPEQVSEKLMSALQDDWATRMAAMNLYEGSKK